MIFVCVHVHIGTEAWKRDGAQLTTVERIAVSRKTNGGFMLYRVQTSLQTTPQPPPVSLSLVLASKDLCGPRRQESLILRLGGPYTVLLHILHADAAGHRERPLCF